MSNFEVLTPDNFVVESSKSSLISNQTKEQPAPYQLNNVYRISSHSTFIVQKGDVTMWGELIKNRIIDSIVNHLSREFLYVCFLKFIELYFSGKSIDTDITVAKIINTYKAKDDLCN